MLPAFPVTRGFPRQAAGGGEVGLGKMGVEWPMAIQRNTPS